MIDDKISILISNYYILLTSIKKELPKKYDKEILKKINDDISTIEEIFNNNKKKKEDD